MSFQAICQAPASPVLYQVTVDPETGYDVITWYPSPSGKVDYYVVANSVLVNPLEPYALSEVGRTISSDTVFVNKNTESGEKSIGYTVFAISGMPPDSAYNSEYDEPDSTIFVSAAFDSCNGAISLTWNDYNKWRGLLKEFVINQRLDNGLYLQLERLPEGIQNYVLSPVQENISYRLFVEAINKDNVRRSASNVVTVFTGMSQIPDTIKADYATFGDENSVALSFSIDPDSELKIYKLLRSSSRDGLYDTIADFTTNDKLIRFTDAIPFTGGVYYYKLVAYNNCEKPVTVSNLANTILLGGNSDNASVTLNWNEYVGWYEGVEDYTVYRVSGGVYDSVYTGPDTGFRDDFSNRVDYENPQNSQVCYQVAAVESGLESENTSRSNLLCFSLHPRIYMPNAFIPNSDDGINNTFGPVFSFAPERYELAIFNRSGLRIWEGSEPWDGKVNGKSASEGVYLYHLKIFNYSDPAQELSGSVTIVYR